MKIILKENIEKLGFADEIVKVKNGFARNFLIPKGKAVIASESAVKVLEEKLRQQSGKEEKVVADANNIAEVISGLDIKVKAKVAEDGQKLFGSVTTVQFTEALQVLGHEIDKRFVKLTTIKEIGKYEAEVRLHRNVSVTVPFQVVAE
ncbi:MAG: 50S ribosomal protein L9 [Flavobacteriales bacterium]|nr:50S ribosomal protein L9 [Flavobacteriales bacterium]